MADGGDPYPAQVMDPVSRSVSRAAAPLSAAPLPVAGNGTGWELVVRARGHVGGLRAVPTRAPRSGCLLLCCLFLCCLFLCGLLRRPPGSGRLLLPFRLLLGALAAASFCAASCCAAFRASAFWAALSWAASCCAAFSAARFAAAFSALAFSAAAFSEALFSAAFSSAA